ncbi:MAG: LTA synthase family protein [Fibrobacteraceae bacterium]|nr:LTA synthase family protein [Fibrobacteraceae bacterium]
MKIFDFEANRCRAGLAVLAFALSFFIFHFFCRFFLLFRNDAYRNPFVNKPDWYIFHAGAIDFVWIFVSAVPFLILAFLFPKKEKLFTIIFGILHSALLCLTFLDHEVQRFLGSHLTLEIADTYKDVSSLAMFVDYVSMDMCIPWIQFVIMPLLPVVSILLFVLINRFLNKKANPCKWLKISCIVVLVLIVCSELFLHVIWPGGHRMRKLSPVVKVFAEGLLLSETEPLDDSEYYQRAVTFARNFWNEVEGPSALDYEYPDSSCPLCRRPILKEDSVMQGRRAKTPNFIVVFLESGRGMDVGYLNPSDERPSATPILDSLARSGQAFTSFYAAGVPTVSAVLSSHLGTPLHRKRSVATEFTTLEAPSFASVLRDSGYVAHFFAAADPAWDNLSVWFAKWYDKTHYNRAYEDDSSFFSVSASFIRDSLATQGKPFLASLITRSNHYPFNLVPGMTEKEKALPQKERMRYTMHWMDKQLGIFLDSLRQEPWFENTYLIVLADHGFPQGENGISAIGATGGSASAAWIPLVINGPIFSKPQIHEKTAGQHDLAPTILSLAGLRVANAFIGHDLFRNSERTSFAIGAYSKASSIAVGNYRLLTGIPNVSREYGEHLYAISDKYEEEPLEKDFSFVVDSLRAMLDTLLSVNDFAISKNRMNLKN